MGKLEHGLCFLLRVFKGGLRMGVAPNHVMSFVGQEPLDTTLLSFRTVSASKNDLTDLVKASQEIPECKLEWVQLQNNSSR